MKAGTGGNLGLSREYHKKLFGPLFYLLWNCPLYKCFILDQINATRYQQSNTVGKDQRCCSH